MTKVGTARSNQLTIYKTTCARFYYDNLLAQGKAICCPATDLFMHISCVSLSEEAGREFESLQRHSEETHRLAKLLVVSRKGVFGGLLGHQELAINGKLAVWTTKKHQKAFEKT